MGWSIYVFSKLYQWVLSRPSPDTPPTPSTATLDSDPIFTGVPFRAFSLGWSVVLFFNAYDFGFPIGDLFFDVIRDRLYKAAVSHSVVQLNVHRSDSEF